MRAFLRCLCVLCGRSHEKLRKESSSSEAIACDVRCQCWQQKNSEALGEALASLEAGAEERDERGNLVDLACVLSFVACVFSVGGARRSSESKASVCWYCFFQSEHRALSSVPSRTCQWSFHGVYPLPEARGGCRRRTARFLSLRHLPEGRHRAAGVGFRGIT